MTHQYNIAGMTCGSCVAKVKSALLKMGDIIEADVQREAPQATITMQKHISTAQLQEALTRAGAYTISETAGTTPMPHTETAEQRTWLETYKPVLLIAAYVLGVSFIAATQTTGNFFMYWMRYFMAGFFLSFSFFKMLNLKAFAEAYSTYDIVAARLPAWGYIYAFIELLLGVAFLMHWQPVITNTVTLVVMSVSLVGVLRSVLKKRTIQCACLGTVFNLPMSTVTIVEDASMILMSATMLLM